MNYNKLSKPEQQELIEVLNEFGLNEKDRAVYFTLLSGGGTTITPVSRALTYPLTTVQSILKRLEVKGFLTVTQKKSRSEYSAADPSALKKILERRAQDLNNIIPMLNKMKADNKSDARIKIYKQDRMTDIFHEALGSREKLVYEIVSARDFQYILGEKFHFTRRRIKNNIRLRSLRVEAHEIKKYNKTIHEQELREAKFLPREFNFRSSIMLWDETAAFFTTKGEGLAWTVQSRATSTMLLQLFEMLWSVSRRMETLGEE